MSSTALDMAIMGFTDEDRRKLERVDLRAEAMEKRMDELYQRTTRIEEKLISSATRGELRDVEVSIDELRLGKADRGELSLREIRDHETRLRLIETTAADLKKDLKASTDSIKADLDPLKEWHWKELGALAAITGLIEVIAHVLFK